VAGNVGRARYADAGKALREAQTRAVQASGELKPRDWKVLGACFALVSSFSRTSDRVYVDQVAEFAGVSPQRTSESLSRLDDLGVIGWTPSSGRGRRSVLDIRSPRN
jgi:RIO-like serine/threonine protein kinase